MKLKHQIGSLLGISAILLAGPALADTVVYQSASYVNYGQSEPSDYFIDGGRYIAAEFTLGQTTQVSSVGGVFTINGSGDPAFAAIVAANGSSGAPVMSSVLASTTFTPATDGSDQTTPLSVTLAAGSYDLVFGFGKFGSASDNFQSSGLVSGQSTLGTPSLFSSMDSGSTWSALSTPDVRMEVSAVPLPAGLPLLLSGLLGLVGVGRRRRAAV